MLTRSGILAAEDRQVEEIDVPEWGGTVYIRPLSASERWAFAQVADSGADPGSWAVVRAVCDENGSRLFTPDDEADIGEKNGAVIERIAFDVLRISGLSQAGADEIEGNLEPESSFATL